jgi:hypothetical protein
MFSNKCIGLRALNCPIAISRKKIGIPTRKSIRKNGIKNAAPPFLNTKNGNLHTFPRP